MVSKCPPEQNMSFITADSTIAPKYQLDLHSEDQEAESSGTLKQSRYSKNRVHLHNTGTIRLEHFMDLNEI